MHTNNFLNTVRTSWKAIQSQRLHPTREGRFNRMFISFGASAKGFQFLLTNIRTRWYTFEEQISRNSATCNCRWYAGLLISCCICGSYCRRRWKLVLISATSPSNRPRSCKSIPWIECTYITFRSSKGAHRRRSTCISELPTWILLAPPRSKFSQRIQTSTTQINALEGCMTNDWNSM